MKVVPRAFIVEDDFGLIIEVQPTNGGGHVNDVEDFFSKWRVVKAYPKVRPEEERKDRLYQARRPERVGDVPTREDRIKLIYSEDFPEYFDLPQYRDYINVYMASLNNRKAKPISYTSAKDDIYLMHRNKKIERLRRGKWKRLPKPPESIEEALEQAGKAKEGDEIIVRSQGPS